MSSHVFYSECSQISESEMDSLKKYTTSEYLAINKCMRDETIANETPIRKHIDNINAVFDRLPPVKLTEEVVLYRGMYFEGTQCATASRPQTISDFKEGQTIINKGFVSTSSEKNIASRFMKIAPNGTFCCMMEIHFKPGRSYKILQICDQSRHSDEKEYLLPSGCKFYIREIKTEASFLSNVTRYIVDYIPPQRTPGRSMLKSRKRTFELSPGIKIRLSTSSQKNPFRSV